jgi:hypothetical protein
MNDTEINDIRSSAEFKGVTFSKFQKIKVKNELINCLLASKVEPACYWTAELICAGHYIDVWETIILYVSKYIHLGNPKLPIYIAMRFNNFKDILSNGYVGNELSLRNSPKIRQIFAEVISLLCHSRKKHTIVSIKIQKQEEFNMSYMASRLKAPSIDFAHGVFKNDDPKELYIAINEFAYHISHKSKNVVNACYWLEWILEFETICKQNKKSCLCETRTFAPVLDKFKNDSIWIIWDVILSEANKKAEPLISKIINSLLDMFSIKFTSGVKKKRRYIIYFAIALLTETVDLNIEIFSNKVELENIIKKINIIYKDIKKNEASPQTDYLFRGTEHSSLDKTIERLDKMNKIMNISS